mgnify:CR=1 FL=1
MKITKKCYKIILMLLMVCLLACSNNVFATDAVWDAWIQKQGSSANAGKAWDELVTKYEKNINNLKVLTEEEIDVLLVVDGAKMNDLMYYAEKDGYIMQKSDIINFDKNKLKAAKKRDQNGIEVEDSSSDRLNELYTKILGFSSKGVGNLTTEEINECLGYINEWESINQELNNQGLDATLSELWQRLNEELKSRGEETDETITDNMVGDDGEVAEPAGPSTGILGNADADASHTPDEIIDAANKFLDAGKDEHTIDGDNLEDASSTLYNILLSIGILLAVGVGMYLGVKFMVSTAEDKAKVKESLIPYIAGCIVIFSAFVIWKAAILLLGGIG